MAALTAWQGYRFWQMENQQGNYGTVQSPVSDPAAGREPPGVNLSSLDLFGAVSAESAPAEMDTGNLPETNLRLFLRGVLAADGDFPGSALIEDDKGKTEAYLVGDELPGNATLRSVHPNRVIIERSGKLENLYFPESEDRSGISFTTGQREEPAPATRQVTSFSPTKAPATSDEQRRQEIRQRLEQLRERLRNNN
jgi:general secretion pathway protein C